MTKMATRNGGASDNTADCELWILGCYLLHLNFGCVFNEESSGIVY